MSDHLSTEVSALGQPPARDHPANRFLLNLDDDVYAALAPHLAPVALEVGQCLFSSGDIVSWVYFPADAVLSMISASSSGDRVETSMIGREGGAGLIEVVGSGVAAISCVVQVPGVGHRAPANVIRQLAADPRFARQCWLLIEFVMFESRQSGLCQALHAVEPRLARWLLECAERSGPRTVLPLTQEFLSAMLGVQRSTVSTFCAHLQKDDLIRTRRGKIEIVSSEGLEARACECRTAVREQRERLGFSG
jgi:CRP-like cAMP-binding protein